MNDGSSLDYGDVEEPKKERFRYVLEVEQMGTASVPGEKTR